jgi:hypothetical protein
MTERVKNGKWEKQFCSLQPTYPHTHRRKHFLFLFFPSEHVNFGSEWEEEKRREKFLFVLAPEEN